MWLQTHGPFDGYQLRPMWQGHLSWFTGARLNWIGMTATETSIHLFSIPITCALKQCICTSFLKWCWSRLFHWCRLRWIAMNASHLACFLLLLLTMCMVTARCLEPATSCLGHEGRMTGRRSQWLRRLRNRQKACVWSCLTTLGPCVIHKSPSWQRLSLYGGPWWPWETSKGRSHQSGLFTRSYNLWVHIHFFADVFLSR